MAWKLKSAATIQAEMSRVAKTLSKTIDERDVAKVMVTALKRKYPDNDIKVVVDRFSDENRVSFNGFVFEVYNFHGTGWLVRQA